MSSRHERLPLTLSIVTPNYNGAAYLQDCLSSVLSQRKPGLEYIVVDSASKDASTQILDQYSDQIDKLVVEPDNGHADAINKGFALSSGEIMGWLNSDDILFDGTIDFIAAIFAARPDIEWLTGRASSMNESGQVTAIEPARPWSRLRFLSGDHFFIQQESTFWRRSLWERAGGRLDESLSLANDFELWARFFRYSELHTVNRHLGCFRVREGQRSVVHYKRYRKEALSVLDRELSELDPALRRGPGEIIPTRPRELKPRQRNLLERRLSVYDPPIIEPFRPRPATPPTIPATLRGDALESYRKSDLSAFKDRHKGERCFIMGNGPSLNATDLSLLANETVFACNLCHLLFDKIDWRPRYYTCVDSMMLQERAADIESMLQASAGMTAFFPTRIEEHTSQRQKFPTRALLPETAERYYFEERHSTMEALPFSMFSLDVDDWVAQPHTVAITMLQIAAYMGFDEIFLIGCDTRYRLPETVRIVRDEVGRAGVGLVSTRDDDANHFHPAYFGTGRTWHAPNLPMIFEQYRCAKAAIESKGQRVFNATKGGDLDVFTRIELENVFDEAELEKARQRADANRSVQSQSKDSLSQRSRPPVLGGRWRSARQLLKNNLPLVSGMAFAAAILVLLAALAPTLMASLLVLLAGASGATLVLLLALTWKIRRILLTLLDRQQRTETVIAQNEIRLAELEIPEDENA